MSKNFKWEFCSWCGVMMVICPKCGNNTCNAGYGTVDGEKCDVCPEAYEFRKNNEVPPKPNDWKEQFKETHLNFKREFGVGEITDEDIKWAEKIIKQRENDERKTDIRHKKE